MPVKGGDVRTTRTVNTHHNEVENGSKCGRIVERLENNKAFREILPNFSPTAEKGMTAEDNSASSGKGAIPRIRCSERQRSRRKSHAARRYSSPSVIGSSGSAPSRQAERRNPFRASKIHRGPTPPRRETQRKNPFRKSPSHRNPTPQREVVDLRMCLNAIQGLKIGSDPNVHARFSLPANFEGKKSNQAKGGKTRNRRSEKMRCDEDERVDNSRDKRVDNSLGDQRKSSLSCRLRDPGAFPNSSPPSRIYVAAWLGAIRSVQAKHDIDRQKASSESTVSSSELDNAKCNKPRLVEESASCESSSSSHKYRGRNSARACWYRASENASPNVRSNQLEEATIRHEDSPVHVSESQGIVRSNIDNSADIAILRSTKAQLDESPEAQEDASLESIRNSKIHSNEDNTSDIYESSPPHVRRRRPRTVRDVKVIQGTSRDVLLSEQIECSSRSWNISGNDSATPQRDQFGVTSNEKLLTAAPELTQMKIERATANGLQRRLQRLQQPTEVQPDTSTGHTETKERGWNHWY